MPLEYRFKNHIDKPQKKTHFVFNRIISIFFLVLSAGVFSFSYFKNSDNKTPPNIINITQPAGVVESKDGTMVKGEEDQQNQLSNYSNENSVLQKVEGAFLNNSPQFTFQNGILKIKNSVITSRKIKDHTIEEKDIDGNSITSRTVKNNSIQGEDIDQDTDITIAGLTLNGNLVLGANTLTTSNTTVITNLNADLLDGHEATYFQTALTNPITGTGSGVIGQIPYFTGANAIAGSTYLTFDSTTGGITAAGKGTGNLFMGDSAGNSTMTGTYNLAFGKSAGSVVSSGSYNVFFGRNAGPFDTTGSYNFFSGYNAGYYNQTGTHNTVIGQEALKGTDVYTGSDNNIAIGQQAGYSISSDADFNTFLGRSAGYNTTTGTDNFFSGYYTGYYNQTGTYNTAIGNSALNGTAAYTGSDNNIAIGYMSGYSIGSSADNNTFLGYSAGFSNTTGTNNFFSGENSGFKNQTGTYNIAIGSNALRGTAEYTGSDNNIAIGREAGYNISSGSDGNAFLGYQSGHDVTTGDNNILLGYDSGHTLTTGSNNILIGYDIDPQSITDSNQLSIGNLIFATGGFGTGTTVGTGNVGIGTTNPGQKLTVDGTFGILETGSTPTYHTIFQGGDQAGNITYTLPINDGDASQVLTTDGSGVLSWASGSFTHSTNFTYLTTTTDDFVLGASTTANAPLFFDVSTGELDIFGTGNKLKLSYDGTHYNSFSTASNGDLVMTASNVAESAAVIGSGVASQDVSIQFDEDTQDYYLGVDNSDHFLKMGLGTTVGTTPYFTMNTSGKIGLGGMVAPTAMLHMTGVAGTVSLEINSNETTAGNNILMLRSDVVPSDDAVFRVTADGHTYADNAYTSGGADYAEYFYTKDTNLKAGEAVCVDTEKDNAVKRCQNDGDNNIMGIVSSNPSVIGNKNSKQESDPDHYQIIGMLGQISGFVSDENGSVNIGDNLTAASISGYLRKANAGESTVGVAMENFSSGKGKIQVLISRRNQSLTVEKVEQAVTENIANMNIQDKVNAIVDKASADFGIQIGNLTTGQTSQQSQIASLASSISSLSGTVASQSSLVADLDRQVKEISFQNSEAGMGLFESRLGTLEMALNITGSDVDLMNGKLEAEGVVAGAFTVKVVDLDARTLGEASISAGEQNITVETKAVSSTAKIFVTPFGSSAPQTIRKTIEQDNGDLIESEVPITWIISEKKNGESFTITTSDFVSKEMKFDWWIVEEK